MSKSASIDIKLHQTHEGAGFIMRVVLAWLDHGWTLNYEGKTHYLPIGDDGDFHWQHELLDQTALFAILAQKEQRGEVVGVTIIWQGTDIGCDMLFFLDGTVSALLSINRKEMEETAIVDVSWYLQRLITPLIRSGYRTESIQYNEYR